MKITKDHTVQPKGSLQQSPSISHDKSLYCTDHKQEQLVLFCETCDILTCRDCQLLRHKDHNYSFVEEASNQYKNQLGIIVNKIKEKSTFIENAKALISKRHSEICEREKVVGDEIKIFALKLIKQVNRRAKELMQNLNSVCGVKKQQLKVKHTEIKKLSKNINHTLEFSKYLIKHGSGTDVLHTKRPLVSQLKTILKSRCEVPNPNHVVDIRFGFESVFLQSIPNQGTLLVDGIPFNGSQSLSANNNPPPYQAEFQTPQLSPALNHQQQQQLMHRMQQMKQQQSIRMGSNSPTSTMGGTRYPPNLHGALQRGMHSRKHPHDQSSQPHSKHYNPPAQSSTISSSNHHPMAGRHSSQQQRFWNPQQQHAAMKQQQLMQQQQQMQQQHIQVSPSVCTIH